MGSDNLRVFDRQDEFNNPGAVNILYGGGKHAVSIVLTTDAAFELASALERVARSVMVDNAIRNSREYPR